MIAKPTGQSARLGIFILILAILALSTIGKPSIAKAESPNSSSHQLSLNEPLVATNVSNALTNSPVHEIQLINDSQPLGITLDSKGNVWFAEGNSSAIVEYNPSQQTFKKYPIPMNGTSMIWFLVFDNSGNLWFANQIQPYLWRFTPSTGQFANFSTGKEFVRPFGLAYDPSTQKIWFTSTYTDQIGYFDLNGDQATLGKLINATGTPVLSNPPYFGPTGIQIGPKGNIFVSEPFSGNIVEYSPSQQKFVNVWKLPKGSQPVGIALDNTTDRVWFANHASSLFGYVDESSGKVAEFATSPFEFFGDTISLPYWTKITPSGTVWFDEHASNKIARYNPVTGSLTEFAVPTNQSAPLRFVIDNQRGVIWFTEWAGSKLSEINLNATCQCSVQLSQRNLTLGSSPAIFYLKYQTTGNQSLSSSSPNPLLTGTFELDGYATNNLTVSYSVVNSSHYRVTLTRGDSLIPGNYTITVCPRSSSSDNITSPAPIRECGTASLSVIGSTSTGTNHAIALINVEVVLAVIVVVGTILLSVFYVRRWRANPNN